MIFRGNTRAINVITIKEQNFSCTEKEKLATHNVSDVFKDLAP